MFVDFHRFQRKTLLPHQRSFLSTIVPVAQFVQRQTVNKALSAGKETDHGISACIITAECIWRSDWGRHPVAQKRIKLPTESRSCLVNNPALLPASDYWLRRTVAWDGKEYRAYGDLHEFAIDLSDVYGWTEDYSDVLATKEIKEQVQLLSSRQVHSEEYRARITSLIVHYGLWEFDSCD